MSAGQATTTGRRFHGLFVGINRYQARSVRRLASAVCDATALQAIFSDNLGGTSTLLVDAAATRSAIVTALDDLRTRSRPEDVVVVAFSGHGSDTHELVTHDADPHNLPTTSLPLDEFTELISAIPARQLVIILDCCFSGGAGAKVLKAPLAPRGGAGGLPMSTDARLEKMAGVGRLILAASTGDQEAWEDPRLGHGLLTYHLIQALLGAAAPGSRGPGRAVRPAGLRGPRGEGEGVRHGGRAAGPEPARAGGRRTRLAGVHRDGTAVRGASTPLRQPPR